MNDQYVEALRGGEQLLDKNLILQLPDVAIVIKSNSEKVFEGLGYYFRHIIADDTAHSSGQSIEVLAYESKQNLSELDWKEWAREPGKTGRKDSYIDIKNGRLIRKVRTGMVFMQSETHRIASGPCLEHLNQVINFINNQYMNYLQQQGWLICHAAALAHEGKGVAIAGFSGGGKSTMMLHLLNKEGLDFVSNDRLFIKRSGHKLLARGIPKLPRINPGTILNNDKLSPILSEEERITYQSLNTQDLWDLEKKYDVDVAHIYGSQRFQQEIELTHFVVLNWSRNSDQKTCIQRVDIAQSSHLLDAIMKSPGPFYHDEDGNFINDTYEHFTEPHESALSSISLIEVTGEVNFSLLETYCLTEILECISV